jgi:hypothetical protein
MENNLIDFDELLVQPMSQSKWEIENNERNNLIDFIESKIISQVKNMFEEKDRIICELLEKQRIMEHKIDNLSLSLEKKDAQIISLVATINANNEQNEQNEYFINELKERGADGIQIKMLSDDVKKLDIKSEWVRLQFNSKSFGWPETNNYIKSVKLCDFPENYPSPYYGKKIKNQDIITEEQYYELDGLILLVAIKKQNNMTHDHCLILSQQAYDKNVLSIIKYLDYAYDNLILPLPISKNNTFEDAMKIKEDIEKLGGIVQIV